ncbi:MAG: hypothetical protein IJ209_05345 [Bacteroidaceae bacterium]|nr:hypothetical protein [Bacteroidaceae bacterium]
MFTLSDVALVAELCHALGLGESFELDGRTVERTGFLEKLSHTLLHFLVTEGANFYITKRYSFHRFCRQCKTSSA